MKAVVFDMDGVVYNAESPIPGAAGTVSWLREQNVPVLFLTNTSSTTRAALVKKLARFEISAGIEDIFSPPSAAAEWLRTHGEPGSVALFVREAAVPEFHGLELLPDTAESGARYVVVGDLEEEWNFHSINRAFRLLYSNPEAELIALGMTRYWRGPTGLQLDVAPFVTALEHAVQRQAIVFGKPGEPFFRAAVEKLGVKPAEVLMVGDDIEVDVGAAQMAGLKGALVKTGKFREADLDRPVRPYLIFESIAELPEWWQRLKR